MEVQDIFDELPRKILVDTRLSPRDRNAFWLLGACCGYEKFPQYPEEVLEHFLGDQPGRNASNATVSGSMRMLRLTGWLLRLPGGNYQLQQAALTARQSVEQDPKFGQFLDEFLERGSKAAQEQAGKVRIELEEYGRTLLTDIGDPLEPLPYTRWPEGLSDLIVGEDRKYMIYCLRQFKFETQQQLLEQLVACCRARQIETPMHYLYGLAKQAKKGLFVFRPPVSG